MRLICLSDTHAQHGDVEVPRGDVLIHAGDFSHSAASMSMLRRFNDWLGEQPCRYKIVVPGNHDRLLEDPKNKNFLTNATVLVNSGVTITGVRFWGSPVTRLSGVGFGMPDDDSRKKLWAQIPKNTDVLVTHTPAFGILDCESDSDENQGCPELRDAVLKIRPLLHVFGHAHGSHGQEWAGHTYRVNAALYEQEFGGVERLPIVIDLDVLKAKVKSRNSKR